MALAPEICAAMVDIVGSGHVCFDRTVRRQYGCMLSDLFAVVLEAVVFPASTGEVAELMRGAPGRAGCRWFIDPRRVTALRRC